MITIVNLTPHAVTVRAPGREPVIFPPSGPVARVREILGIMVDVPSQYGAVPLQPISYADHIDELPDSAPDTYYLVSRVTAAAVDRLDLVFPQGDLRDSHGQIFGCLGLGRFDWTGQRRA